MQELNANEVRRVAAAMYQPEPWDPRANARGNPLYLYLDASDSQQDLTNVKVVTA